MALGTSLSMSPMRVPPGGYGTSSISKQLATVAPQDTQLLGLDLRKLKLGNQGQERHKYQLSACR